MGAEGPVRCAKCKAYMNPFMQFSDYGRKFTCNLCGAPNATPHDYVENVGPDGRRRDVDERPELCCGSVEFVATPHFQVPLMSVMVMAADQTGALRGWAIECEALKDNVHVNEVFWSVWKCHRLAVQVRPPMPPTHFFLVDVAHTAVTSGATAAACRCIASNLDDLQGVTLQVPRLVHNGVPCS